MQLIGIVDKYRSAAKKAAWYDFEDDPPTYNPFKKYRPRRKNTASDAEDGRNEIFRTQSDNIRPQSAVAQSNEMRGSVQSHPHANTLPPKQNSKPFPSPGPEDRDIDYMIPRTTSPVPEELSEQPNEKEIAHEIEPGKDSTSSNTAVPESESPDQPRWRNKVNGINPFHHREPEDAEEDKKIKPKQEFTFMSQLRATL